MKPMTEEHLALFRRHMVEIIDMHFDLAGVEIGKDAPGLQLRRALMDVPRHLFVPQSLMLMAYQDTPLPSASTRRSHSRSSALSCSNCST